MDELSVHIDLPTFRGFVPAAGTRQLLMARSGGSFLYWADGVEAPPRIARPPFWNTGVMSDNEAMFHPVSAVGTAEGRATFAGLVRRSDRLFAVGDDGWEIRDDRRVAARLDRTALRMSLLWKARVFCDEGHRASFGDSAFDLTPDLIAEVFPENLAARGVASEQPSDPLGSGWQDFLARSYPPPFIAATSNYVT
jgi:hypothetical protein